PGLGRRFRAVLAARGDLLSEAFLEAAGEEEFRAALVRFYEACTPYALHMDALRRRAGIVRHALAHLLHSADGATGKIGRCLATQGPYWVAGLGPSFWSALLQGLEPRRHPGWTPAIVAGLRRLGLWRRPTQDEPGHTCAALQGAYDQLRARQPEL